MAVSIAGGDAQHNGTFQSSETFTQSTATAVRTLNPAVDISFLGMGTATAGPVHNQYELVATTTEAGRVGDAVEGQWHVIMATATGRADCFVQHPTQGRLPLEAMILIDAAATGDISVTAASATGDWVFQTSGDMLHVRFLNGTWNFIGGHGATMAAAT